MNRLSSPSANTRVSIPLRATLATALLALSMGEPAAAPARDDPFVEPAAFEQNFPMSDDPARSVVELTDNQISEALFRSGAEPADSPTLLAGSDPLQTP